MLAAWQASPARFREDANAEEDLALGGYRDRVLVELAQNAADAAARSGSPGRLRFELDGDVLRAANTGAAFDAAGVESASTLRASSKRDDPGGAVGRFGVGFAAVRAVSDEPSVASAAGGVTWSLGRLRADVGAIESLADELARRGNALPVLRLPYPWAGRPPEGFDTEVALPLRDAAAVELVRELLDALDSVTLLTLPALGSVEVVVDGRSRIMTAEPTADGAIVDGIRWFVRESTVTLVAELLRDRPVEERGRRAAAITWAVPVADDGSPIALPASVPGVVHAPTPTDEPLSLPALLVAPLPLDPTRRHVASGPLRDALLDHAATAYADVVRSLPMTPAVLSMVPTGIAAGAIDGHLRARILEVIRELPFLPVAGDSDIRQRPSHAVTLDDASLASDAALVHVLAEVVPGMVPAEWAAAGATALNALDVRRLALGSLLDELATVSKPAVWWHGLYAALAGGRVSADSLAGLPVPLASGGVSRSARGLLMPGPLGDLSVLGLRTIDSEAAHPFLLRLGALEADPRSVLTDDRTRAAVENSYDAEEPAAIAEVVLRLVSAAGIGEGEMPWLADLALDADDGSVVVAGELLMPGGVLAGLVVDDAPFATVAPSLVERWGYDELVAVGVIDSFAIVRADDVMSADLDLDLEADYLDMARSALQVDEPVVMSELVGVRDLELISQDSWGRALTLLAQPPLRAAVVEQAVVIGNTTRARVPSYTAWWLREHRVVDGRLAASDPLLIGLFDVVAFDADDEFLVAAGALRDVADADDDEVASRLGDHSRPATRSQVKALYALIEPRDPPAFVRAVRDGELVVVAAADAVVIDAPDLAGLVGRRAIVPASLAAAEKVADALDLPLASELAEFAVASSGQPVDDYVVHSPLLVADVDGSPQPTAWRLIDGVVHVDADALAFGLGRGRSWRDGQWGSRYLASELLAGNVSAAVSLAEADLD